jgi:D-serine deaminase-like pyridoxal phosphate-dependent protein
MKWYEVENIEQLDTPSLLVYRDRVRKNIEHFKSYANNLSLLRPHVKTNKSAQVTRMLLDAGITKFKCATIAEAEMVASCNAEDVLLAHQPVGPKAKRLAGLAKLFTKTRFSAIVDDVGSAQSLADAFADGGLIAQAMIDLNVGMNRSGIKPEKAMELFESVLKIKSLNIIGLHVYDGHLRDSDLVVRTRQCEDAFAPVSKLKEDISRKHGKEMVIVAGGTPTFPIHAKRGDVECSPGTFVYWDKGYETLLPEQKFQHAAVLATRVISVVDSETICVDLGHKAVASENPLNARVHFLNLQATPVGHSEEHLVLKIEKGTKVSVGDMFYGIPHHICPTVALHESVYVIENNRLTGSWNNMSRKRKITI